MDRDRALIIIKNFSDPAFTKTASDRRLHELSTELQEITGHPKPIDVLFHTFFEEDLENGLVLTPEFLLDYMIRNAGPRN